MRWLAQRLTNRLLLGTTAGLLISSLVFLVLFVGLYREQLARERAKAATAVTLLLRTSLENAMLKRDIPGLRDIVSRLGRQQGVRAVLITNPRGEVRFASDPADLGRHLPIEEPPRPTTRFIPGDDAATILRSIHPVHNQPACQECHGPLDRNPVNGILYIDLDARSIVHQARITTLLLMGSGALIVLVNLTGGGWLIHRLVLRPVARLAAVSERLAAGDLDARCGLAGSDELALLGARFDQMAQSLKERLADLKEKDEFMQRLVDAIPDGIRVIDGEYRVVLANAAYRNQLGYEVPEDVPRHCHAAAHGRDSPCPALLVTCPVKEIAEHPQPLRLIHRHRRQDGGHLDVELYAAPMEICQRGERRLLVIESIRDLAQEVRFSHELRLSELGRLAAGVAHEIHNPLAAIRLALNAAERAAGGESPDPDLIQEYLTLVDHEVEKCCGVTERLLKLSVPPSTRPTLVILDTAVDETLRLLRLEAEQHLVTLRFTPADPPLRVLANDSDLRMLALNLAQNACHAMPQGGTLTVTCARRDGWAEVSFADTGVGIDPRDLVRIFEPFFSRRADGVTGTGLGLPITKAIVESHGGQIRVDSLVGVGTRVLVSFPDADLG